MTAWQLTCLFYLVTRGRYQTAVMALVSLLFLYSVPTSNNVMKNSSIGGGGGGGGGGGHKAHDAKYPYIVSIRTQSNKQHFCSGSVINLRWIVTAANCFELRPSPYLAYIGKNNLQNKGMKVYKVDKFFSHPNYKSNKLENDIGLMHVSTDIQFSCGTQPNEFPKESFHRPKFPAMIPYWGNRQKTPITYDLQEVGLLIVDQKKCVNEWHSKCRITEKHICAHIRIGDAECFGEIGSPLVAADGSQIGIVSSALPCERGRPDVFIRIDTFLHWIYTKINENVVQQ